MTDPSQSKIARREFLKLASIAGAYGIAPAAFASGSGSVLLILDPANRTLAGEPVQRAIAQLRRALETRQIACVVVKSIRDTTPAALTIVVAGPQSKLAVRFSPGAPLSAAESFRLCPGHIGQSPSLLLSAHDPLGFVYGLLELTERVQFSSDPIAALHLDAAIDEKPANEVRCVGRYFCSELEDKPWFYDKAFWSGYLDHLVACRFNRFTLAFGLEYDFPRGVTDDYFHFVYPYLFDVPGYPDVRVMQHAAPDGARLSAPVPLTKEEQQKNFGMLRFIASETAARGLHFQLGIWTHAYEWTDSPHAYHHIDGLTPATHARYCRDALSILLKECPQIQGLTLRVHGESGIPEGSYPFWKTLFEAISSAGRTIEIDMHAKGVDQTMIDIATATGMPVKLGAKFSAEHQSLGYHQADIRALEIPDGNLSQSDSALFSLSSGARRFTRYGYADFFRDGAKYKPWFRLWPGTQRHLLCVDPETISNYARSAHFCGAAGLDLMEPLTFKGREGSGQPGGRCAYADASLNPAYDWQKYDLYYRVWGRKLYNPDAEPEIWRRAMRPAFGPATEPAEASLASASRILALLTSAHLPSASNHDLWYEMPTNMPIIDGSEPSPYGDTPTPKVFATVSPLDPQMFSTVYEHAHALVRGGRSAKHSPIDVAHWLENLANESRSFLERAQQFAPSRSDPSFRRLEEDVLIQIGLGTFFANKIWAAVLMAKLELTGGIETAGRAIAHYEIARDLWASMAERARTVYQANVSYGSIPKRSGHWSDRLPAIDTDLSALKATVQRILTQPMQFLVEAPAPFGLSQFAPPATCTHTPQESFSPGQAIEITLAISSGSPAFQVRLFYRHVNQAERWQSVAATRSGNSFTATIPANYTSSPFPMQYYFEVDDGFGKAWMHPGFNRTLSNQPYFVVDKRSA